MDFDRQTVLFTVDILKVLHTLSALDINALAKAGKSKESISFGGRLVTAKWLTRYNNSGRHRQCPAAKFHGEAP